MTVMIMTPFGRQPVTAALIERVRTAGGETPLPRADKWDLLKALATGRAAFGITDRDLAVLNALLSFYPARQLEDDGRLIVFPSNTALAERAHGMAESTLRRHLAALVAAGLLLRHDSPNGKRYAARGRDGAVVRAFGFDLRPLLCRAAEIHEAAAEAEADADRRRRLREEVLVVRRDALKLLDYAREIGMDAARFDERADVLRRGLRRRLDADRLRALLSMAQSLLAELHLRLETGISGSNDAQNERHHQSSITESSESEEGEETGKVVPLRTRPAAEAAGEDETVAETAAESALPAVPLSLVLRACPELATYAGEVPRNWHELIRAAYRLRPMLGIDAGVWEQVCRQMGPATAAITLAAMLQRFDRLRSPGGYLRTLGRKAEQGAFSPGPMIMALLNAA